MRKRLVIALVVVNAILATAVFAWPAVSQVIPLAIFRNCCKEAAEGPYCCEACCWFVHDCDYDDDCKPN